MFIEKNSSNKGTRAQEVMQNMLKQKKMENLFEIKYSKNLLEMDTKELEAYDYIVNLDDINDFNHDSIKVRSFMDYKENIVTAYKNDELNIMLGCEGLLKDIQHEFFKF